MKTKNIPAHRLCGKCMAGAIYDDGNGGVGCTNEDCGKVLSPFAKWYHEKIGISLTDAKKRGVTDLNLLQEAFDSTCNSENYSDHLIAALRCLDDANLRLLATNILSRLPSDNCTERGGGKGSVDNVGRWLACDVCGGSGNSSRIVCEKCKRFHKPSEWCGGCSKLTNAEMLNYVDTLKNSNTRT